MYARLFTFLPIDGVGSVWKSFLLTNTQRSFLYTILFYLIQYGILEISKCVSI